MIIRDVMEQVAGRLSAIPNLRVFGYPPDDAKPPFAVVDFPDEYTYDETYGRGMDRMTLPVNVYVSRVVDRTLPDEMSTYANGDGPASIKAVLESGTYTAFDTLRVTRVEFDWVKYGSGDYLAALFTLDIAGQGS